VARPATLPWHVTRAGSVDRQPGQSCRASSPPSSSPVINGSRTRTIQRSLRNPSKICGISRGSRPRRPQRPTSSPGWSNAIPIGSTAACSGIPRDQPSRGRTASSLRSQSPFAFATMWETTNSGTVSACRQASRGDRSGVRRGTDCAGAGQHPQLRRRERQHQRGWGSPAPLGLSGAVRARPARVCPPRQRSAGILMVITAMTDLPRYRHWLANHGAYFFFTYLRGSLLDLAS
jgi:hypothetical protein